MSLYQHSLYHVSQIVVLKSVSLWVVGIGPGMFWRPCLGMCELCLLDFLSLSDIFFVCVSLCLCVYLAQCWYIQEAGGVMVERVGLFCLASQCLLTEQVLLMSLPCDDVTGVLMCRVSHCVTELSTPQPLGCSRLRYVPQPHASHRLYFPSIVIASNMKWRVVEVDHGTGRCFVLWLIQCFGYAHHWSFCRLRGNSKVLPTWSYDHIKSWNRSFSLSIVWYAESPISKKRYHT